MIAPQHSPLQSVDSSAWIEYFTDSPNADEFAEVIEAPEHLLVPSLRILEVFRWVLRERGEDAAIQVTAVMQQSEVIDLDATLAPRSAKLGLAHQLPLADGVMYATARHSVRRCGHRTRPSHPGNDEFLVRRARVDIRGSLETFFSYRVYTELAGPGARLQEAWIAYDRYPALRFRAGQFKIPFSLESLTSALWIDFVERSMAVTAFQPAEDIGAMVFGSGLSRRIEYAVSVFNGRGKNRGDTNDAEDLAARLAVQPFASGAGASTLLIGGSYTRGTQREDFGGRGIESAGRTRWMVFGQDVSHAGAQVRRGIDGHLLLGPTTIRAEWIDAELRDLTDGISAARADFRGWYLAATQLLTGERKPRNGTVVPRARFDSGDGGWGAWEVIARWDALSLDDRPEALTGILSGARRARALTAGVTWWPNRHVKSTVNVVRTAFGDPLSVGDVVPETEQVALIRFQFNF